MSTVILRTGQRVLVPLMVAFSLYLLLRGHNEVGGGFIGGLAAGAAVVLEYLTLGTRGVLRYRFLRFVPLCGWGLALATVYGIGGLVLGQSFLQSAKFELGQFELAASLVFDVGVWLIVVGMVVAIMTYLGEPRDDDRVTPGLPTWVPDPDTGSESPREGRR
ncbi:Na(+)/H(+) antiporter subunit B [Egibacter rhizosphaerae]|uniref:Na(+)/H(+) antiporter subunit B n=1 Tax=Egibacter rhizosphaerae TaxID=1670831 RepID=A0A411YE41_9ACTN|nr:MnhB domain-containing protein [Egibacter rhizosphaerae]QBI19514.1 Na(+)/H(+) antiporter subunit B [Egibacter rhizosphaerae]